MTRKDLEKLWPIIEAYKQGKTIELYDPSTESWSEIDDPCFDSDPDLYRVASEPKYRSFRTTEECFEEMKKHEPFGWVVNKAGVYTFICGVRRDAILFSLEPTASLDFQNALLRCTFADGTPFGKKEE